MRNGRNWTRGVATVGMIVLLAACGGDSGGDGDDAGGGGDGDSGATAQVTLTERIEGSEDCDELEQIRAEQTTLAEEQDGPSGHTGWAIAARARMEAIGCEIEGDAPTLMELPSQLDLQGTEDCDEILAMRAEHQAAMEGSSSPTTNEVFIRSAEAKLDNLGCEYE